MTICTQEAAIHNPFPKTTSDVLKKSAKPVCVHKSAIFSCFIYPYVHNLAAYQEEKQRGNMLYFYKVTECAEDNHYLIAQSRNTVVCRRQICKNKSKNNAA